MQMKKIIVLIFLCFIASGCAIKQIKQVLPKEIASGSIVQNGREYFIVVPSDFQTSKGDVLITYQGSIEQYHLFRSWEKMRVKDHTSLFALRRDDCVVEDEVSLTKDEEFIKQCSFRSGEFVDGKIIVGKCEK